MATYVAKFSSTYFNTLALHDLISLYKIFNANSLITYEKLYHVTTRYGYYAPTHIHSQTMIELLLRYASEMIRVYVLTAEVFHDTKHVMNTVRDMFRPSSLLLKGTLYASVTIHTRNITYVYNRWRTW
jgi:hypothetical protein